MKNYQYLQQKYIINTYSNRGITFVDSDGPYLIDSSGKKYLDLMTNYGVNIFGYNHPHIIQSLTTQLKKLSVLHGSFSNNMRAMAAQTLVKRCGGELAQVYFSNSGTEAIEASLKFAVLATGKKKFISCRQSYHGKTLGSLSATCNEKFRRPFEPLLWTFRHIDYNDIQQVEESIDDQTGAFLVEPIQGEGGINVPDPGYLRQVKKLCASREVLLILDEVQTGVGRTGHFLASHEEGISTDIVCLGKGLAGGLPVGATLVSPKVSEKIPKSVHTSTLGGNPLVSAGILATLELLDDQTLAHIKKIGNYFLNALKHITSDSISKVRGKGLMLGIEVFDKRDKILQSLQNEKVLASPAADNVIRFLPPFIIKESYVDHVVDILKRIFKSL